MDHGCAHGALRPHTPRRIMACSGDVSWLSIGGVAAYGRLCHRRAEPCRTLARPYRSTSLAVSQHCISTRPVAMPLPPCHDTIDCIVTPTLPPLSHDTILCIVTLLSAARITRSMANCLVVSWTSSGRIAATGCPVSRHMVAPSQPRYNVVSRHAS